METRTEFLEKLMDRIEVVKKKVYVGKIICYRPNLVEIKEVCEDGVVIEDPYGVVQKIDWEDVVEYNPDLYRRRW